MHTIILLALTLLGLAPEPQPTALQEPVSVNECGAPLCIYDDGTPATHPCRTCGTPWVPGNINVCEGWVCEPIEPVSTCLWRCTP